MQEIEDCPSFSSYSSSISFEEIAAKVIKEEECSSDHHHIEEEFRFHPDHTKQTSNGEEENDGNNDKDDFEFAFVNCRDTTDSSLPIFPIFNQDLANFENDSTNNSSYPRLQLGRLFVKEFSSSTSPSSSSETDVDLASYCIWKPKTFTTTPDRTYCPSKKKSKSIGNSSNKLKSFKIRDLIHRSNSGQNKMYVYLANHAHPNNEKSSVKGRKEDAKKMDRKSSGKKLRVSISKTAGNETLSASSSPKEGDKRGSLLPYKRDFIGFFGFYRKVYPFA